MQVLAIDQQVLHDVLRFCSQSLRSLHCQGEEQEVLTTEEGLARPLYHWIDSRREERDHRVLLSLFLLQVVHEGTSHLLREGRADAPVPQGLEEDGPHPAENRLVEVGLAKCL